MLQTIKKGMNNFVVMVAQLLTGFDRPDGVFDSYAEDHIKQWQKNHGLDADGIVGTKTWREIAANAPTTSVKKNRYGTYAKAVQLLLGIEDADGIFGNKTKEAVIEFQKKNGLDADGIVGSKTWRMLICDEKEEVPTGEFHQPPNFKQYDSKWAKNMYSNHGDKSQTMKSSGCGPTSMADIVAEWWDANITPWDMAQKSMEWKTRTYDSGTSSSFFKKTAALYGAKDYKARSSFNDVVKCLNEGGYVIVCFGKGVQGKPGYQKWTKGGHYCCIWKWDGKYFYINDPASASSSRAKGTKEEVMTCRKGFYLFWKK